MINCVLRSVLLRDNISVKQGDWCLSASNNWSTARNAITVVKAVGQAERSITFPKIVESTRKHTILIRRKFVLLVTFQSSSTIRFLLLRDTQLFDLQQADNNFIQLLFIAVFLWEAWGCSKIQVTIMVVTNTDLEMSQIPSAVLLPDASGTFTMSLVPYFSVTQCYVPSTSIQR